MKTSKLFIAAIFCLTLVTSCSDDDDNPPIIDPVELITDVTLTFTNTANPNDVVTMTDIKPDGQEGTLLLNEVVGTFTAGASYALELAVTDASDPSEVDDILNDDIVVENDEHFFKYRVAGIDLSMSRDADDLEGADGTKLGLKTTWVAGAASTGNLEIILVHIPATANDSNELGSTTGGEEDFNIVFTGVEIQ